MSIVIDMMLTQIMLRNLLMYAHTHTSPNKCMNVCIVYIIYVCVGMCMYYIYRCKTFLTLSINSPFRSTIDQGEQESEKTTKGARKFASKTASETARNERAREQESQRANE